MRGHRSEKPRYAKTDVPIVSGDNNRMSDKSLIIVWDWWTAVTFDLKNDTDSSDA